MKNLMISLMLSLTTISTYAQEFAAPTRKTNVQFTDTTTTYTYKCPDKTYKVYVSKNGAYYVWKTSKRNKFYKYYLPKEVQLQMGRKY